MCVYICIHIYACPYTATLQLRRVNAHLMGPSSRIPGSSCGRMPGRSLSAAAPAWRASISMGNHVANKRKAVVMTLTMMVMAMMMMMIMAMMIHI